MVSKKILNDGETSIRKANCELNIPYSTIRNTLKYTLGMKTNHYTTFQEPFDEDFAARMSMCEELKSLVEDTDLLETLCFSGEATFNVLGSVNKHNSVICSIENPQKIHVKPIKFTSVCVRVECLN